MKRTTQAVLRLALICGILPISTAFAVTQVTKVEFVGATDPAQVVITGDGKLTFEKTVNAPGKQIIVEIKDAQIAKGAGEKIDTSSSSGVLSQISPYQVEGKDVVRVVLQMRDVVDANVVQEDNVLKINIPTAPAAKTSAVETPFSKPPVAESPAEVGAPAAKNDKLDQFFENQITKRFIGKHITLQLRDADSVDVFRLIGEASGFNIVLGSDVTGKVTLSLVDVPWDLALDTLLTSLGLGAERSNNVLRVITLAKLTTEKQEELRAKQASQRAAVRMTKIFSISYAKPSDLIAILRQFGSASAPGVGDPPNISVDERTNSIIVQDTPDNIERMKKLVLLLDTQTPQILIEAKVIEATETFGKNIGGSIGGGRSSSEQAFGTFNGSNPVDPLIGTPSSIFPTGAGVATSSKDSGTLGMSNLLNGPTFGLFSGLRITSLLNIGEQESQVKIVSSPKTVVLNKETASIVQGTPVLVPGTTTTTQGVVIPANTVQPANLSLTVKPTVTNDGNIMMDLAIVNAIPISFGGGLGGVGNRQITTKVVTESGATLVVGGIFNDRVSHDESGFPFLRKIPILGHLFGTESDSTNRSELFIFITPRILNEKESGLTG